MKKRVLSLFMVLVLCLTLLPTAAFAEGEDVSISGGVIGGGETGGETGGEGGGIYVAPGSPTEGGGGTYIPGEDTRTEIWCTMKPSLIQRNYDGTTDGGTIPIDLTFTDGTNEIKLKEGTGFTAKKTFDSADAGRHTVTVEIELIGDAAAKYRLKAGEETFTIGGYIDKAYPDLTVSLSKAACTVGEKILPLLSVEGAPEGAAVTYYYTQYKPIAGSSEYEGSEAMPKIDENTAISDPGTYYVYAKTGETTNYKEERSTTVELTVNEAVVEAASITKADGTDGGTYESLPAALNAAQDGDTVKLLADHVTDADALNALGEDFTFEQYASIVPVVTKTLTLDLNHKTVDYLEVGFSETNEETQKKETLATGNLTVTGEGAYGRISNLMFMAGALDIRSGEIGGSEGTGLVCDVNSGTVTISGGTVYGLTVFEGAAVTVNGGSKHAGEWVVASGATLNITDGTFGDVQFTRNGTIAISSGTFKSIKGYIAEELQPLMSLLDTQKVHAFYKGDDVQDGNATELADVTVKEHTHSFENGKCDCGASYVASVTTSNGVTTNYTSLDDALDAAKDGDTVKLLGDAEITKWRWLTAAITLDLNGKTITTQSNAELYIHAQVIVQDNSTGKNGGMAGTYLLNVQEKGDLIIQSGTFDGKITINVGKLTIEGGIFKQEVDLRGGDSDSVFFSGGTFTKLFYPKSGGSFLDLLADGYAFFYTKDSNLVNAAEISGTFLYNVQVQQHTHSFTDGACACGYTCPHTSVDENGVCKVCNKRFAASITEGNDVTYYDLFNDALVYAFNNDGCTLKLLADVTGTTVMINNPFIFDLNGHSVYALSVDARATIKDSGTTKGRIGKVTVSNEKVTDLTLGSLLEEGYAFKYGNGYWANDSYLQTTEGSFVTVEKAPIQSVNVYAKDKNNQEILTIAYGATGEVTLVSSCRMGETSGADLTYLWYKLEGAAATAPLEGATGANYTLPDNLAAGTHTYLLICTSDGYSKSAEITITVTPISLVGATVTVSNLTYNGNPQEPTVTVKLGDETLSRDNDYTVQVTKQTDAGSYKLTIKGGGNYSGEIKDVEWKIEPMKIDSVMVSSDISKTYDGTATVTKTAEEWANVLTFKTLPASDVVDVPSSAYTISDAYFVEKSGEETIHSPDAGKKYGISFKITLKSSNYVLQNYYDEEPATAKEYTQSGGATFAIAQADAPTNIRNGALNVINGTELKYTYDAKQLLPDAPKGTYGNVSYNCRFPVNLENGYYVNDIAIDDSVLTLTIAALSGRETGKIGTIPIYITTDNYESFDLPLDLYAVNKITPVADGEITAAGITYGDALSKSTISGKMKDPTTGDEVKGTFTWTNGMFKPAAGDYQAEWTFTPAEGYEEYATATGTVTVKVAPKSIEGATITLKKREFTYNAAEQSPTITGVTLKGWSETITTYDIVSGDKAINANDSITLTIKGTGNYTGTATAEWKIIPAKLTVSVPSEVKKEYDGTTNATVTPTFNGLRGKDNLTAADYSVTAAFDNAKVGYKKTVIGKVTLNQTETAKNYVLTNDGNFSTDDGTITKAVAPTVQPVELTIYNGVQADYYVDLPSLPDMGKGKSYGTVGYRKTHTINLSEGYKAQSDLRANPENLNTLRLLLHMTQTGSLTGEIGTVTIPVTTSNYQDITLTVKISAKNRITPTGTPTLSKNAIIYGDALNTIALSGKLHDNVNNMDVDGTFEWVDGTHIPVVGNGTYAAEWIFEPTDTEKYLTVSGRSNITVEKARQYGKLSMAGYTYGKTPSTPTLTDQTGDLNAQVTYSYAAADSGSVQTWDISNPPALNAGTYRMYASIGDTDNYYGFEAVYCEFVVAKATPTYTVPTGLTAKYGQTLADVTLPDGWSWMDSSESVGGASTAAKTFQAKFTPKDTENYNTVENIELEVTVNKADGGNLKTVELEQKYTDASDHTYTPDWAGLPAGQDWTFSSEASIVLPKQDFAADGNLLTYAISGGKAGDKITLILKASCDNYEDFTITLNVTLTEKDDQKPLTITGNTSVIYGEKLTLTTTGGSGMGAVTYRIDNAISTGEATIDPNTGVLTPVKVGSVSVIATKAGDNNYNDVTSAPFVLMIKPATSTGEPKYTKITTSGKTLKDVTLTIEGSTLNPSDGKLEWVDDKGEPLPDDTTVKANTTYKWRFTPDDDNYTTLTGEVELYHKSSSGGGWYDSYYTIKATAGAGGSISPSGNVSVREGGDQTFTITPDKGYAVANVKIDGKSIGAVKSYTFENVSSPHTIEAIFVKGTASASTGDSSNLPLWSALLLASTLALAGAVHLKRKRAR
ncbi:YDG domain-containing protein [Hominenteromicrobium sp.]|uniref:YDG domain-containing protein n=1 Tax=Hominenteromicrobium sp. TaxID=3073581 RepID=UPI003A9599B5